MRDPIKVFIVDDHPVFRDGLRQCLEARKTIRVLATVGSGEELWKALRAHGRPQIVLMDVELPGEGGIELTRALHEKHPEIRVVMLTAFSDSERVFAALKAGAAGYLPKNVAPDEIRATVERAAAGEPTPSGEAAGPVPRARGREPAQARSPGCRGGRGYRVERAPVPARGLADLRRVRAPLRRPLPLLRRGPAGHAPARARARAHDRLPLRGWAAHHRAPPRGARPGERPPRARARALA